VSKSRRDQRAHRRKVWHTGRGVQEHNKRVKRRARRVKANMRARIDLPRRRPDDTSLV